MAIFLTQYLGFPLGRRSMVCYKGGEPTEEGRREGQGQRQEGQCQRRGQDARRQGQSMTCRYADLSEPRAARRPGTRAAADRSARRPFRNGLVHQYLRPSRDDRSRSTSGRDASPSTPGVCRRPSSSRASMLITIFKGLQLDIGAPAVHGLPLRRARPLARRVPLDHCGALLDLEPIGDATSAACATTSRTPLRRHRRGHQSQGRRFGRSTVRPGPGRSAPALRLDSDHRRVASGGR